MTKEWNNRDYRLNQNGGNGKDMFKEHNERMREHRKVHASIALVNSPRLDEAALIGSMKTLPVGFIRAPRGGSRLHYSALDWSDLIIMPRVASYKLTQN